MKIIFLDVDGVLNCAEDLRSGPNTLNPIKVQMIRSVVGLTGSKIVLSSTWRKFEDSYNIVMQAIGANNFADPPITPIITDSDSIRGDEVQYWLDNHGKEVTKYAIVDDDSDFTEVQMDRLVKTTFEKGLTAVEARKLEELLV